MGQSHAFPGLSYYPIWANSHVGKLSFAPFGLCRAAWHGHPRLGVAGAADLTFRGTARMRCHSRRWLTQALFRPSHNLYLRGGRGRFRHPLAGRGVADRCRPRIKSNRSHGPNRNRLLGPKRRPPHAMKGGRRGGNACGRSVGGPVRQGEGGPVPRLAGYSQGTLLAPQAWPPPSHCSYSPNKDLSPCLL